MLIVGRRIIPCRSLWPPTLGAFLEAGVARVIHWGLLRRDNSVLGPGRNF